MERQILFSRGLKRLAPLEAKNNLTKSERSRGRLAVWGLRCSGIIPQQKIEFHFIRLSSDLNPNIQFFR